MWLITNKHCTLCTAAPDRLICFLIIRFLCDTVQLSCTYIVLVCRLVLFYSTMRLFMTSDQWHGALKISVYYGCYLFLLFVFCPKGRLGMSGVPHPPVWNLRAVIWFHFPISSLLFLPSPLALSCHFSAEVHSLDFFPENSQTISIGSLAFFVWHKLNS